MYHGADYVPRINFTCTEEQLTRSQRLFTRSKLRGDLLRKVFDDILDMVEEHGETFAVALAYSQEDSLTVLPRARRAVGITKTLLEGARK